MLFKPSSLDAVCAHCGKPIGFVALGRRVIVVDAIPVRAKSRLVLSYHPCAALAADGARPVRTEADGARGPVGVKSKQAVAYVRERLTGLRVPYSDLLKDGRAAGFSRTTLMRALDRVGAERDGKMVYLPAASE